MIRIYISIFLFLFSLSVNADNKKSIAICAEIQGNIQRLECYDKLAKKLGVDKPAVVTPKSKGLWNVREEISKVDDSTNVYLSLQSNDYVPTGFGNVERPVLQLRCQNNKTEVFIHTYAYLGTSDIDVLTRLDKTRAVTDSWSTSTDHKAVFYPWNYITYIKKLLKHNNLLVQLTPYGENTITFEFDLTGLSESLKPLRKACSW